MKKYALRTYFAFCMLIIVFSLLTISRRNAPVVLVPTGQYFEFSIRTTRYQGVWTRLPESEYTTAMNFGLGEEFLDLDDPTWWERYQKEIEDFYLDERSENPSQYKAEVRVNEVGNAESTETPYWIYKVPPVDWLKGNVERGIKTPSYLVDIFLPKEGILREVVSHESYIAIVDGHPYEKNGLAPMQVIINGVLFNTHWAKGVFATNAERTEFAFVDSLKDVQEIENAALLYMFEDEEHYVYIQLPEELLELTEEDFESTDSISITLKLEILRRH